MRRTVDKLVDRIDVGSAMRMAIDLGRSTHPHPNPRVGAVILAPDGSVVSTGAHVGAGTPHAEVLAIEAASRAGVDLSDTTLFVTLEPCAHTGRTPPCTLAVTEAGIRSVVVGAIDPDERVAGRGVEELRTAGVSVRTGVLTEEVEAADPAYFHHRRTGRARVTLKVASTLDGRVAAADGSSRWITGEAARADVHALRAEHDAVMVGIGTVIADDPLLDVRLDGYDGRQPTPVVVAGRRDVPQDARLLGRDPLVYRDTDAVDLRSLVTDLPEHGILSVLVEGGPTLAGALLDAGVVDEIVWYVAGAVGGGEGLAAIAGAFPSVDAARRIPIISATLLDGDVKLVARKGGA